jgi:isocitrate dehydrogenase
LSTSLFYPFHTDFLAFFYPSIFFLSLSPLAVLCNLQGIGPEIAESVKAIFTKAKVPIKWEEVDVTPTLVDGVSTIPADSLASIKKNTIALKGPLATPSALSFSLCFSFSSTLRLGEDDCCLD